MPLWRNWEKLPMFWNVPLFCKQKQCYQIMLQEYCHIIWLHFWLFSKQQHISKHFQLFSISSILQGLLDFVKCFVCCSTKTLEFWLMAKLTACLIGFCAFILTAGDLVPLKKCECAKEVKVFVFTWVFLNFLFLVLFPDSNFSRIFLQGFYLFF